MASAIPGDFGNPRPSQELKRGIGGYPETAEQALLRVVAVGCSVLEEHHRAGIERERECTNQRGQKKHDIQISRSDPDASHLVVRRCKCDAPITDMAESVA